MTLLPRFTLWVRHAAPMIVLLGAGPALAQADRPVSFADLSERLLPSVVNISTEKLVEGGAGPMPNIPPGAPFEDLFRDFFDRNQQRGPRTVSSLGSGFVIDVGGIIVTNNHVIKDADEIVVNFTDGSSLPAELIGTDPKTDIAVLRVEPETPLTAVEFGDSDALRVGDWVLAIGNPFGLGGSVSAGIVSAENRDINAGPYDDFIQTDAAINRGNSGGPLFNMDGEVVGVNTAIISPSGGSVGIGFSVPSNLVEPVVAQLREYGETRRGWLGVRIQTVTPEIAEGLGLDAPRGALVASITDSGPAAAAGVEAGDVIIEFNGVAIDQMRDLPRIVAETPVGERVDVTVWRDGRRETVRVRLGRLEDAEAQIASASPGSSAAPATVLGMRLAPLDAQTRAQLEVPEGVEGVVVTAVEDGSVAAAKGIQPGQLIVEANQTAVASPADVAAQVEAAREAGRKSVLMLVRRQGEVGFVALSLEE